MLMMGLWLGLVGGWAWGAEPVLLYREPLDRALAQVNREAAPGELVPRRLAELLQGSAPYLVGAVSLSPCAGGVSQRNVDVLRWIGEAEELRVALRPAEAQARLEAGLAAWACLGEPADASVGARLHFLVGIQRAASGDVTGATDAFRAALRSDPALSWDPDFAPDARPLFEAVQAEPAPPTVALQVVPDDARVALRVDGRTLALDRGQATLSAGTHLIQLQDGTALWAHLETDAWLVVPASVDEAAMWSRLDADAAARRGIEGIARGSGVEHLFVPTSGATWELSSTWTRHRLTLPQRLDVPLLVSGGSLTLVGGVWMLAEHRRAVSISASVGEYTDTEDYQALQQRYDATRQRWLAAAGVAGMGLAAAGVGTVFWVEGSW